MSWQRRAQISSSRRPRSEKALRTQNQTRSTSHAACRKPKTKKQRPSRSWPPTQCRWSARSAGWATKISWMAVASSTAWKCRKRICRSQARRPKSRCHHCSSSESREPQIRARISSSQPILTNDFASNLSEIVEREACNEHWLWLQRRKNWLWDCFRPPRLISSLLLWNHSELLICEQGSWKLRSAFRLWGITLLKEEVWQGLIQTSRLPLLYRLLQSLPDKTTLRYICRQPLGMVQRAFAVL